MARQRLLFAVLCLVWGTTWLAMKVGVNVVPPAFFSGVRWTVAGLLLLGWWRLHHHPVRVPTRLLGRVIILSLIMISLSVTVQLYGLQRSTAGLAAIICSALTPLFLLVFAVAMRQESPSWRQGFAIVIGIAGILVLYGPQALAGRLEARELLGVVLLTLGTVLSCVGSVLSRPLLRTIPPVHLAGITNLIGGVVLLVLSLPLEPGAWQAARLAWGWQAWFGWFWMVFAGSLGASIIFFILVRDWGASRTGSYAFITPVIAVLLGMAMFGEQVDATQALGMALMLGGAVLALRRKPAIIDEPDQAGPAAASVLRPRPGA